MSAEDLQFALELLKQKRIKEAKDYLESLDDPIAKAWLGELESLAAPKREKPKPSAAEPFTASHQVVKIWDAWRRNFNVMLHKEWVVIGISFAIIVWFIGIVAFSAFWLLLTVIGMLVMVGYLLTAQEVTEVDQDGKVRRSYRVGEWEHYMLTVTTPSRLTYSGQPLQLNYPPSLALSSALPSIQGEKNAASTLISFTILALWVQGMIEVYRVYLTSNLMTNPIQSNRPLFYLMPTNTQVALGALEHRIVTKLSAWSPSYKQARPWQRGPTPYELTLAVMERPRPAASRELLAVVAQNAMAKKLLRGDGRGFAGGRLNFRADVALLIEPEGKQILRLDAEIRRTQRDFLDKLYREVTAGVAKRTPAEPKK